MTAVTVVEMHKTYTVGMKKRVIYGIMTAGGVIGMAAAFLQILEKITLLENADATLSCNLNSVFSCSNVLNAWQSSVFGFPNSVMCLALFTIFTAISLVGLTGGTLPKKLRLWTQGLSLFMFGFAVWFLTQSIYVIGALCILCIFCFIGLLMVNWGWFRVNADDLPFGRDHVKRAVASGADTFIWALIGLAMAFAMIAKFY